MRHLKMKPTVDKLDGLWADNVDCCAKLTSSERFANAEISGRTRKVRQDDLYLQARLSRLNTCVSTTDGAHLHM